MCLLPCLLSQQRCQISDCNSCFQQQLGEHFWLLFGNLAKEKGLECFGEHLTVSFSPIAIKCVTGDDYQGDKITISVKCGNLEVPSLTVVHRSWNPMYRNISMKEFKTKNLESLNLPEFSLIGVSLLNYLTLQKTQRLASDTGGAQLSGKYNLLCPWVENKKYILSSNSPKGEITDLAWIK